MCKYAQQIPPVLCHPPPWKGAYVWEVHIGDVLYLWGSMHTIYTHIPLTPKKKLLFLDPRKFENQGGRGLKTEWWGLPGGFRVQEKKPEKHF